MLSTIESINSVINNFIWGLPAMICIIGVGIVLSVKTRFIQIRKFPYAMKITIGRMLKKRKASDGALTPFQAVCTALAATVGTGNIAGVAGAIAIGGPGAVFWMWISAILGMCTKFSEVVLAVHFRETNNKGELVGGPMYYIKNGLNKHWHWLAYLFSALGVLTVFGTGNATQVNTITAALDSALINYNIISADSTHVINLIIGIIIMILIALIMIGGIKRIGRVTEKLIPFMAVLYIILAIGVVLVNINNVPAVFKSIFQGAFSPASVTGGAVGSFFMSMKKGVARGIFSNEAGLGTGSIAHACADTKEPVKQGLWGIFEVFFDTFVICTLTALVILTTNIGSGAYENGSFFGTTNAAGDFVGASDSATALGAFSSNLGTFGTVTFLIILPLFAFTTVLAWSYYGEKAVDFCFRHMPEKKRKIPVMIFKILFILLIVFSSLIGSDLIWALDDTFNGLMALPNLIALVFLSGQVARITKNYFDRKNGKNVEPMLSVYPEQNEEFKADIKKE